MSAEEDVTPTTDAFMEDDERFEPVSERTSGTGRWGSTHELIIKETATGRLWCAAVRSQADEGYLWDYPDIYEVEAFQHTETRYRQLPRKA